MLMDFDRQQHCLVKFLFGYLHLKENLEDIRH